jgi:prepilin peptidase CpaA
MGWPWLERLHAPRTGVPYGIALAAAALVVFPESPIWKAVIA